MRIAKGGVKGIVIVKDSVKSAVMKVPVERRVWKAERR